MAFFNLFVYLRLQNVVIHLIDLIRGRMRNDSGEVYIVDDEYDYRFLVEQVFIRFLPQYNVRFFTSGDDLLRHILAPTAQGGEQRADLPGLVLLDMHMPGHNGLQTLMEIRQHKIWKQIPIVMMSNFSSQQERDSCYAAGVNSFLIKPIGLNQLLETMDAVCKYWLQLNQSPSPGL
jgi:CheY-like chemotaxis protein